MRLTCPNCRAQYEVPETAIPPEGRDVECSNCGHSWFQSAAAPEEDALILDEEMSVPPAGPPPRPRKLDPGIEDVLREEAEREARARAAENAPLESQPELGLTPPPRRRADPAQGNPFPDVDEINSTLRSASEQRGLKSKDERRSEPPAPDPIAIEPQKTRTRAGVLWGFALVAAAALVYAFAPNIAAEMPGVAEELGSYTAFVDEWRVWFHDVVRNGGADRT